LKVGGVGETVDLEGYVNDKERQVGEHKEFQPLQTPQKKQGEDEKGGEHNGVACIVTRGKVENKKHFKQPGTPEEHGKGREKRGKSITGGGPKPNRNSSMVRGPL